jgi:hypothetical protein
MRSVDDLGELAVADHFLEDPHLARHHQQSRVIAVRHG